MNSLIPLLVVIPLVVAFAIPLAVRMNPRSGEFLTIFTSLTLLAISLFLPGQEIIYHVGNWPTPDGIDLRVDGLSRFMLLIISGLALVVVI